jgi:3-hydroxy-3-methylglutaryl CoA synthase
VLEKTKGRKRILMTSYGSGAGSDSFYFETKKLLEEKRKGNLLSVSLGKTEKISYGEYLRKTEAI